MGEGNDDEDETATVVEKKDKGGGDKDEGGDEDDGPVKPKKRLRGLAKKSAVEDRWVGLLQR